MRRRGPTLETQLLQKLVNEARYFNLHAPSGDLVLDSAYALTRAEVELVRTLITDSRCVVEVD